MTTNGEWLDYLAHNAPDELAAWFDAEHVETEERALDGGTEPESSNTDAVSERYATAFRWLDRLGYGKGGVVGGSFCDTPEQGEVVMPLESWREHLDRESDNEDSRDKLEADMREIAEAYNMDTQRHGTERFEHELYCSIIHLLDRQAAITEREHPGLTVSDDESLINWRGRNYLPQSRVLNAERERDEFSLKLKHEMELNLNNRNAHDLERIDELTAERDYYCDKFGKCLDYADAIHALMDDEGMA